MKPNTKLKQWCYEKAEQSLGHKVPWLGNLKKDNEIYFKELNIRAEIIYNFVK